MNTDNKVLLCVACGMRDGTGHQTECPVGRGLSVSIVPTPLTPPLGAVYGLKFDYRPKKEKDQKLERKDVK